MFYLLNLLNPLSRGIFKTEYVAVTLEQKQLTNINIGRDCSYKTIEYITIFIVENVFLLDLFCFTLCYISVQTLFCLRLN